LSPVPEFGVGFSLLNLARRQPKSEKGNSINESQCQNQNPPVPKSSAYDMGFASAGQVRSLVGSHKVSYAKFLGTFERAARPRGPAEVLASSPVGGRRREPSK
jgi:hypothetical protein